MENFSDQTPFPEPAPPSATNPLNVGFGLVITFALGLALGFLGRPTIIDDVPIQIVVTVVPENSGPAVAQVPAATEQETIGSADPAHAGPARAEDEDNPSAATSATEASAAVTPTLMDFVMSDARHWQGDDVAPVVIVEFSDFK